MHNARCSDGYRNRIYPDLHAVFMSCKRIGREDYLRNAEELAPWLLGKILCHRVDGTVIRAKITETECYLGENDTACHASKGKTKRNAPMYFEGGHLYVYLCYGMHSLINIVSGEKNSPEAVLIRGVEGASGPGKASKLMQIDTAFTGIDLCDAENIWLEDDGSVVKHTVSKRIGIDYAKEEDRNRLWRFIAKTNK